jgi:SAM-dependent methyltransferase
VSGETSWVDAMPELYDRGLSAAIFAPYAEVVAQRCAGLEPETVLELAAGTGIVTAQLVRTLPRARVIATDLNPAMVDWGRERVPSAEWRAADAMHLDVADHTVDLLVCQFGVMFFPDRPASFAEAARVLRPGGSYFFTAWDEIDTCEFESVLTDILAELLPHDPPTFLARTPHGYHDRDVMQADVTAGGLQVDSIERIELTGTAPSVRALTKGYTLGTPLRFEIERAGDLDAVVATATERMTARYGEGPASGALAAFLVTARSYG